MIFFKLKQSDACCLASVNGCLVPDARLHLADVRAAHHKHAKTGLSDASADGERELVRKQHLVEGELSAVVAVSQSELSVKRLCVNTDTHRGDLDAAAEYLVPEEEVAVELPVVIVRRSAVVTVTGLQLAADLHNEGCGVILYECTLTLTTREIGVHILKLLCGHERNVS